MKKIFFYILLFLSTNAIAQNKDSVVNHSYFAGGRFGNIYIEASFKDQLLNGPFVIRNSKKKILLKGQFKNNTKIGVWEKYFVNDTIETLLKKIEYITNRPAAILFEKDFETNKIIAKNKVLEFLPDTISVIDSLKEYYAIEKQFVISRNGGAFNASEYGNLMSRIYRGIAQNKIVVYKDKELKHKIEKPDFAPTKKPIAIRTCDNFLYLNDYGLFQKVISAGIVLNDKEIYWVSMHEIEKKGLNLVIDYSMFNAIKQNLLPSRIITEENVSTKEILSKTLLMEIWSKELQH